MICRPGIIFDERWRIAGVVGPCVIKDFAALIFGKRNQKRNSEFFRCAFWTQNSSTALQNRFRASCTVLCVFLGCFFFQSCHVRVSPPVLSMWPCTENLGWGAAVIHIQWIPGRLLWLWKISHSLEESNQSLFIDCSLFLIDHIVWLVQVGCY
jgi:hypothetical protein